MVTFVASVIGAAAVFARVASAVPMDYSMMRYVNTLLGLVGDVLIFLWL
jgi:hypothetical protein